MSGLGLGASPQLRKRHRVSRFFQIACLSTVAAACAILIFLLGKILADGAAWVDWQFISSFPSRFPEKAGVKAGLVGSVWIISMTAMIAIPLGVASAVYLEEYAGRRRWHRWIELNIANLAGVPSIVYGMLGVTIFVRWLHLGRSLLAGSLTLSLLILPVVIIASRESLRSVPQSLRQASLALGATRWQTTRHHVLPAATPGIVTGVILALSRAIGETAPLILVGALSYVAFTPEGPLDEFTVLPIQIYGWASRPQADFHNLSAAGIVVLLIVLLTLNAVAATIRHRSQGKRS